MYSRYNRALKPGSGKNLSGQRHVGAVKNEQYTHLMTFYEDTSQAEPQKCGTVGFDQIKKSGSGLLIAFNYPHKADLITVCIDTISGIFVCYLMISITRDHRFILQVFLYICLY